MKRNDLRCVILVSHTWMQLTDCGFQLSAGGLIARCQPLHSQSSAKLDISYRTQNQKCNQCPKSSQNLVKHPGPEENARNSGDHRETNTETTESFPPPSYSGWLRTKNLRCLDSGPWKKYSDVTRIDSDIFSLNAAGYCNLLDTSWFLFLVLAILWILTTSVLPSRGRPTNRAGSRWPAWDFEEWEERNGQNSRYMQIPRACVRHVWDAQRLQRESTFL